MDTGGIAAGPALWSSVARWGSQRASARLVWGALLSSSLVAFVIWQVDPLDFLSWATQDQGATLRADDLIAAGKQPGIDFGYYYGLLPLLVFRVAAAIVPSPVLAMSLLGVVASVVVAVAECVVVWQLKPTRLGALTLACIIPHT